ncbi:ABC transporter permease [Cryptosporangium sp. NPDC051539]|uniref:ABC transporter permease n=1 Tax=Cryptosporangium sp. NPDC051539 TaxID=3363962 RepID=UPI0037B4A477
MKSAGGRWLLLPPLALLAIGLVGPLLAVVAAGVAADGPVGMVTRPFSSETFLAAAPRTLWLSLLVTIGSVLVGGVYAVALAAASPKLAAVLFGVLFLTFWVSLLVRTFGWVLTLQPSGALDVLAGHPLDLYQTTPGLIPAMIHILLPYLVLPVYADLRALDPAQVRAARSLGAGEWQTIRSVVLPAIRPGIVAGAVIVFVLSIGFYVTPAFLGGPGGQVVAIVIGTQFGRLQDLGGAAAMGVLLLVATLGLYLLADRFLGIGRSWDSAVNRD